MFYKDVIIQKVQSEKRPEAVLIQKANEFQSKIWIEKQERRGNAKSLISMLSMKLTAGEQVRVLTEGEDEQSALEVLTALLTTGKIPEEN